MKKKTHKQKARHAKPSPTIWAPITTHGPTIRPSGTNLALISAWRELRRPNGLDLHNKDRPPNGASLAESAANWSTLKLLARN